MILSSPACGVACGPPLCDFPGKPVTLVGPEGDPTLGSFEGDLVYAQTAQQTPMSLHVSTTVTEGRTRGNCTSNLVTLDLAILSADGVLHRLVPGFSEVKGDGVLNHLLDISHPLDPEIIARVNTVVPYDYDPVSTQPLLRITFNDRDNYHVQIVFRTLQDEFVVAGGELEKVGP